MADPIHITVVVCAVWGAIAMPYTLVVDRTALPELVNSWTGAPKYLGRAALLAPLGPWLPIVFAAIGIRALVRRGPDA